MNSHTKKLLRLSLTIISAVVLIWAILLLSGELIYSEYDSPTVMQHLNQVSTSTPEGKAYETEATKIFFGDAAFMRECAPADAPVAETLSIYFMIKNNGSMGSILIRPETEVAKCIRKHVANRSFPKPPTDEFVAFILLKFKK